LATVGPDGWPAAALVGFSANPALEIMFGTDEISRKAENIAADDRVCFEVTDIVRRYQVQAFGRARLLPAGEYLKRRDAHYAKLPGSLRFEGEPGQEFFVIEPRYVVFRDCNPEHSRDWVVSRFTWK